MKQWSTKPKTRCSRKLQYGSIRKIYEFRSLYIQRSKYRLKNIFMFVNNLFVNKIVIELWEALESAEL